MSRQAGKYIKEIKSGLISSLKKEKAFWSYDCESIDFGSISDELLIAYTLRFLDLDEINLLFKIFPYTKIKMAWKNQLIPEGEYLYTLNRFFAWYYFKAKNPDTYVRNLQTRHLNKILNHERCN